MTDYPFNADKPVKADTIANFCIYTEQNAEHLFRSLFGYVQRAKFRWKDADEIYIGPGCYHHSGSTRDRLVWWTSELTFQLGSGGSNAASDDVDDGAITWHYIFIDDSAVNTLASNELTAVQFLNDTTAPTWSDTKRGWYTGNDRCIGAVLASAANEVLEFYTDGTQFFCYANYIEDYASAVIATDWSTEVTLTIPAFSTKANCMFSWTYVDAAVAVLWRTDGQTATDGHRVGNVGSTTLVSEVVSDVICSSSLKIDVKESGASGNTLILQTNGYYLPVGM